MTNVFKIDAGGIFRVAFEGPVKMSQILETIAHQWRLKATKVFWDLSNAQIDQLSTLDMESIALHVERNRPTDFLPGASAFLVARNVDYGMMRMAEANSDTLGFSIKISQNREELEKWLLSEILKHDMK